MGQIKFSSGIIPAGISLQVFTGNDYIPTNCNAIYFRNQGTSTVTLNNKLVLQPGQDFSLNGNDGELFSFQWSLMFSTGATNNLLVMWKQFD